MPTSPVPIVGFLFFTFAVACSPQSDDRTQRPGPGGHAPALETRQSALTGTSTYVNCPAPHIAFLEKVAKYGRIVSNSPAFQQCVSNLRVGTPGFASVYMPHCSPEDRAAGLSAAEQVSTLLPFTRLGTPLKQTCDFADTVCAGANACVSGGGPEEFYWESWLDAVHDEPSSPDNPWWPLTQAAGLMWHEIMHTYGYWHPACSDPSYSNDYNTVPKIVEDCMTKVMGASGQVCGDPQRCGANALPIITAPTPGITSCQCIKDPRSLGHDVLLTGGAGWTTMPVLVANPDGSFTPRDNVVPDFPGWAANQSARKLFGDFNGDSRSDVALTAVSGWTTLPVAFGGAGGDGTFVRTNEAIGDAANPFYNWAAVAGVVPITGDFNGDGRDDVALVNQDPSSGWTTIPVAYSTLPDGRFTVTNRSAPSFAAAARGSVGLLSGDFNADGRTDLALVPQQPGGTSIPIAFATADGSFIQTSTIVGDFAAWCVNATKRVGDFNGDGKADIALIGRPGWTSVPVALSRGDGSFDIYNPPVDGFPDWSTHPGSRSIAGDFNGDGRSDIALIGGQGWSSIPVLFSAGTGTWIRTNQLVDSFPSLMQNPSAQHVVADFNRDGLLDIGIVRVAGWNTMPIAYSTGYGNFTFANPFVGFGFTGKSAESSVWSVTGNYRQ